MNAGPGRLNLVNRMVVTGVASALVCGGIQPLEFGPSISIATAVSLTAAIDQSSSTLGFANSNMYQLSTDDIDQELELMESLGVTNVRISIAWASIEAQEGQYNWDAIDYVVNAAADRNMGILGVLSETPEWAGTPYLAGMPDPAVFAQFAQMVATRYAGQISAYEIWNEPNAINSLDPVDPAAYTTLLQAAYPVIKAVDPSITVIGGVLGSGLSHQNVAMNPIDFLNGMYAAGAEGFFDALSFHPYDYTLDFSSGSTQPGSPLQQLQQLMSIMAQNGDGDLKIWATEYGEPTTPQHSEQEQYDFIQDFLNTWPSIAGTGPMFIFTLRDPDSGSSNQQDNLGVYYTDWDAKQAVQAIIDYLDSISGPTEPIPADHPIIAAIKSAVQWLGAAARTAVRSLAATAADIADEVIDVTEKVARVTAQVVSAVADTAVAAIKGAVQFAAAVVTRIAQATVDAITGAANFVKTLSGNVAAVVDRSGARMTELTVEATGQGSTSRAALPVPVDSSAALPERDVTAAEPTTSENDPRAATDVGVSASDVTQGPRTGGSSAAAFDQATVEAFKAGGQVSTESESESESAREPEPEHLIEGGDTDREPPSIQSSSTDEGAHSPATPGGPDGNGSGSRPSDASAGAERGTDAAA